MQWNEIKTSLYDLDYIASEELAMSIHIAINLERPLLLEGEAGIGKTALALVLSKLYKTSLIRLQCYEGLDASSTIYEWNYQKQLLSIRLNENKNKTIRGELIKFDKDFLQVKLENDNYEEIKASNYLSSKLIYREFI